jgi:hypothetical protein
MVLMSLWRILKMREYNAFADGYNTFVDNSIGSRGAFQGANYVNKIAACIDVLEKNINEGFKGKATDVGKLKGNIAEFWHSGTHNIDAAIKEVSARTFVNRSNGRFSVDISSNFGQKIGLKYIESGALSAKAQAESHMEYSKRHGGNIPDNVNPHASGYNGQIRVIPAGQLDEAKAWLERQIAKESTVRPELVEKYKETLSRITDRITSNKGSQSIPLTKEDAEIITKLAKEGAFKASDQGISTEELIQFQYVMRQSLKAGLSAVTISMALKIAPELYKMLMKAIKSEKIGNEDLKRLGVAALEGSVGGFMRGSVSAGIQTACLGGHLGSALKSADPTVIAAVTVITMNAIKNAIKVATKDMSKAEFANACMRDLFVTTCALVSGGVSQGLTPTMPVLGYMIGSFLGSIAASFIYDTGYKAFLSFCCDSGLTFFGLVDQDYTLPKDVMMEIGIQVFEYDKFEYDKFEYDKFEYDRFEYDKFEYDTFQISFLRRGVIGVNKIGYV